jgi:hypothetical protein
MTIPSDMLLHWKMDETVNSSGDQFLDHSGNGYHWFSYNAAPNSQISSFADATRGRNIAYVLANLSEALDTAYQIDNIMTAEGHDPTNTDWSCAFWFKYGSGYNDLGSKTEAEVISGNYGSSIMRVMGYSSYLDIKYYPNVLGQRRMFLYTFHNQPYPYAGVFTTTISSGWNHIAFTLNQDNKTIKAYLNGVLCNTTTLTNTFPNFSTNVEMSMGSNAFSPYDYYTSDWLMYARELSAAEVSSIYNDTYIAYDDIIGNQNASLAILADESELPPVATQIIVPFSSAGTKNIPLPANMHLREVLVNSIGHTGDVTVSISANTINDIEITKSFSGNGSERYYGSAGPTLLKPVEFLWQGDTIAVTIASTGSFTNNLVNVGLLVTHRFSRD